MQNFKTEDTDPGYMNWVGWSVQSINASDNTYSNLIQNPWHHRKTFDNTYEMKEGIVILCGQVLWYLKRHAFISTDKSAYLKGHFTQTSLHRVIDYWLEILMTIRPLPSVFFIFLNVLIP